MLYTGQKKIKRSIGVISKIRHYVNTKLLTNLYYSFIYSYLIYGIVAWGNSYSSTTKPLYLLQKKAISCNLFLAIRSNQLVS